LAAFRRTRGICCLRCGDPMCSPIVKVPMWIVSHPQRRATTRLARHPCVVSRWGM